MRIVNFIILGLISVTLYGQNLNERISLTIENKSTEEILTELENRTDFHFYYANQWLDTVALTKRYNNVLVSDILRDLFEDTDVNFYIAWDSRIILTVNNSIYSELPQGFLEDSKKTEVIKEAQNTSGPILLAKQKANVSNVLETIRIGKEQIENDKSVLRLSGYVKNNETDEPIQNLTLFVRAVNKGVLTGTNGFYEIELPPGSHLLQTSAMGIEASERVVILYDDGQLDFTLNEYLEQLDEVVVEADAIRNVEDTSTGNTRIGSEESKNVPLVLGERDVLKIATTLPGITSAGEGASGFNVRGSKTDQNLILLDNAVIYNPTHFFGFFQAFNPFAINDLNIYKGSIPAEFGGRLSSVSILIPKMRIVRNFVEKFP